MSDAQRKARLTVLECAIGIVRDLDVTVDSYDWEIGALVKERYDTNKDATYIYETAKDLRTFIKTGSFEE